MNKRTNKEIEMDTQRIKEAAKTAKSFKELAALTGLTAQKVKTTLTRHPIIYKRIVASLEDNKKEYSETKEPIRSEVKPINIPKDNESKTLVICDAPALVYGLQACTGSQVVVPQFVVNSIEALSNATDFAGRPMPEASKAARSLSMIYATNNWATIAPKLKEETLLVDSKEEYSWRAKALVALACNYWAEGYNVTIKTRTGEIKRLAELQGCISVDFVPADSEVKLVKVS